MKIKPITNKIPSFLKELAIVTIGVLIALFVSNLKENRQAHSYYEASLETVKNEVESNYANLKSVIGKQSRLQDSISRYRSEPISISQLIIEKGGGLQVATLSNSGLEFYKKNQINSVDFDLMSELISMETTSEIINTKMEKLMDFLYPNFFTQSKESKELFNLYLNNVINSENELMRLYEDFIAEHIDK